MRTEFAHLYSGNEDRVRLAILLARVRPDERAKVVVLYLLLVPAACTYSRSREQADYANANATHCCMKFRQRFLPSSLFIQSSSSLMSFS